MKVIFAGGGTGGHLMVGLSAAEEIRSRFHDAEIVFLDLIKNLSGDVWNRRGTAIAR
jgi:hypothetical protein